jgi:hypothetical protein
MHAVVLADTKLQAVREERKRVKEKKKLRA